MTGVPSLSRVHIGHLDMDEATGWESRDRLAAIVAETNEQVGDGDHDFEFCGLVNYDAAFPQANRPGVGVVAGHRCIYVDIVSAGASGPDKNGRRW